MNTTFLFALYALTLVLVTLVSGIIPLAIHAHGRRIEVLLSFSAGVMLGAAFFQMTPEAIHIGGLKALTFVLVGALTMFLLERFVVTHVCEEPPKDCDAHDHASFGIVAFLGLSIHTLFDGVALGSSFTAGIGVSVFLAIAAHKIPASLALGSILAHAGYRRRTALLLLFVFALTIPLGAGLYFLADNLLNGARVTAWALAFSAGTFLYLALADLLPQVHRKVGMRWRTNLALLCGVFAMYAMRFLSGDHVHH